MAGAFNSHRHKRRPMINITSLIDVVFILLLFLMVSTTFKQQLGIDIAIPQATTGGEQSLESREIAVTASGDLYFGAELVNESQLRERVKAMLEQDPEASLILRADEGADFGPVLAAIDVTREVGGTKLIIPTRPKAEATRKDAASSAPTNSGKP